MEFVSIDFETANNRPDSACQLAAVTIRGGEIVDEHCWLIRPPRMFFSSRNIAIHGIKPDHVERADTMAQLWSELMPLLDGKIVVAHNARFDVGVLVASLDAHGIACPTFEFSCTRAIARRAWPNQPRYGLKPLGSWLGIEFKHHDALEDARCCALIALAAASRHAATDFVALEQTLRLTRGRYSLGQIAGPRTIGGRAASRGTRSAQLIRDERPTYVRSGGATRGKRGDLNSAAVVEAAAGSQPLSGKQIVFLGSLRGLSYADTVRLAEQLGAHCQASISATTNYVIACGGTLLAEAAQAIASSRQASSPAVARDGAIAAPREGAELCAAPASPAPPVAEEVTAIRLLSERQFLALVPGGKAAVQW